MQNKFLRSCGALLLLIAACAQAQDKEQAPPAGKSFLWEVSTITSRLYLFGTMHAGKATFYPLPPAVEKAFAESTVLTVEADVLDANAAAKSVGIMMYTPPDRLDKHVSPELFARFRRQLGRYSLPESQLAQMKPFMASAMIVFAEWGRLGYLPQFGVEVNLLKRAKAGDRSVVELEGFDVQAALMESLSEKENLEAFESTLTALEGGLTTELITAMVNAWQAGDPELMLEIVRKYNEGVPGAKEFEEKFIWSRHEAMAKKIEGLINESRQKHFVAVGALHLCGPRGLVEMLRKRGYRVRQL
jgi:uncharacterized protein